LGEFETDAPVFDEHGAVSSAKEITMQHASREENTLVFMAISSNNSMILRRVPPQE